MTESRNVPGDVAPDRIIGWQVDTRAPESDSLEALRAELLRAKSALRLASAERFDEARLRLRKRLGRSAVGDPAPEESGEAMVVRAAALTTLARLEARVGEADPALFAQALQLFDRARGEADAAGVPFANDDVIALAHTGRFEDAERRLAEIELRPENAELLVELALAYRAHSRPGDARASLERAAALDPDDDSIVLALGDLLAESAERGSAIDTYGLAAVARAHDGRFDAAERLVDRALELDADNVEAIRVKGELLRVTGRAEEALAWLEQGLERRPGSTRLSTARARTLVTLDRPADALDALREAREPTSDTELVRATALMTTGDLEAALVAAEAAVDLDPNNALAYGIRGEIQRRLDRGEDALASFDSALELDPTLWEAHLSKASVLRNQEKAAAAVEPASRAVELAPDSVGALVELGEALRLVGDHARARDFLERAVALDPENAWALGTLGQVLSALSHPDVVRTLERSLALDSSLGWARDELARWLIFHGNPAGGLDVVDEGLRRKLAPAEKPPPDEQFALLVDRADALRVLGRHDEAREAVEAALKVEPDDAYALATLGQILVAVGRHPEALDPLRRARELGGSGLWLVEALVEALLGSGRPGECLALLHEEEARGLSPDTVVRLGSPVVALEDRREALDAALEAHPDWAAGHALRAQAFSLEGDDAAALKAIDRAVTADPTWVAAHAARIGVLQDLGRAPEVESAIEEALEEHPDAEELLRQKHSVVLARDGSEAAESMLRSVVARDPRQTWAQLELGAALRGHGDDAEAVHVLTMAVEAHDDPETVEALSDALASSGHVEASVEVVQQAIEKFVGSAALQAELGHSLYLLDRNEEALAALDRSLALDFDVAWVLTTRGAVLADLHRYVEALESFDLALSFDDEDAQAYARKGSVLNEFGEFEEAGPLFVRALDLEELPWLHNQRAWAALNRGDVPEALEAYNAALAADADDLWSHKGLGDVLARQGEEARAIEQFDQVITQLDARGDLDAETLGLRGWCAFQRRDYEGALATLTDALAIDSFDAVLQFDFALTTLSSGDARRAVVEYQRALDLAERQEGLRAGSILRVALVDLRAASERHPTDAAEERAAIDGALVEALSTARERVAEARGHSPETREAATAVGSEPSE